MGNPIVLNFSQMASVLGWEERLPMVAPSDRARVLSTWSSFVKWRVGSLTIPFASVRKYSPQEFVDMIHALGFSGIVAGHDFRFGYQRAGGIGDLHRLGIAKGLQVQDVDAVTDSSGKPISSTRCRDACASGDVKLLGQLLGRPHRLVGVIKPPEKSSSDRMFVMESWFNQAPKTGTYEVSIITGHWQEAEPVSGVLEVEKDGLKVQVNEESDYRKVGASDENTVGMDILQRLEDR
mmetsp:Transcript_45350/g.73878  ORF Transcript_45350/g.73878 Transcript_45350/m.73878 type:complete len:236 (+) Transcript_45350:480-1187(+)